MTIWVIWKSRNTNSINNQDIASNETRGELKDLLSDLVRKIWSAARFMEGGRRLIRQRELRTLRTDKWLAVFDLKTGPIVDFSSRDAAGFTTVGGVLVRVRRQTIQRAN